MHRLFADALDRFVIQAANWFMPKGRGLEANGEEAKKILQDADFFSGSMAEAAKVSFDSKKHFRFPSPRTTDGSECDTVFGKLFRAGPDWERRPAVILLHGWNESVGYRTRLPRLARRFARERISAAMIELPFHFRRRPPGADFISADLSRTVKAARQAIADIRALVRWLAAQGCPSVGVYGNSLGAWLGGLAACAEPLAKFCVLITPVVKLDRVIDELEFCASIRRSLRAHPIPIDRLYLTSHRTKARVLIVESRHDVFSPAPGVEELWREWGRPEIWRVEHGHISALMSRSLMKRTVDWVIQTTSV